MSPEFDQDYWDAHWDGRHDEGPAPAHPALEAEVAGLHPGTALDAGSGEGAEASWLAARGWEVLAVDIAAHVVARAATQRGPGAGDGSVTWVEADLTAWSPGRQFDLVTTFYAHPAMPQHAFYERISHWVAPGGTLLIVGHDHDHGDGRGHEHPPNAVTAPEQIRALLDPAAWVVGTAEVRERTVSGKGGHPQALHDVIVAARRS